MQIAELIKAPARSPSDPYAAWQAALAGDFEKLVRGKAPCGFYRSRARAGGFDPVAVWPDENGTLWAKVGRNQAPRCLEGSAEEEFCERVIAWCFHSPITEEVYFAVMEGAPWPDAPPERAATFSNIPADAFEAMRIEVEGERDEIDRWLARDPITDQTNCDRAANWASRLSDLKKKIGAERVSQKRPHDEAAAAVQAQWKPLEDEAGALMRRLKDAQLPFQQEQARQEAEARASAARQGEIVIPAKRAGAGTTGRKSSLRTEMVAELVDFEAALMALKDNPEIRDLVQRLANRVARAGGTLAGCRSVPTQKVA